jgi:hypothetical protein
MHQQHHPASACRLTLFGRVVLTDYCNSPNVLRQLQCGTLKLYVLESHWHALTQVGHSLWVAAREGSLARRPMLCPTAWGYLGGEWKRSWLGQLSPGVWVQKEFAWVRFLHITTAHGEDRPDAQLMRGRHKRVSLRGNITVRAILTPYMMPSLPLRGLTARTARKFFFCLSKLVVFIARASQETLRGGARVALGPWRYWLFAPV